MDRIKFPLNTKSLKNPEKSYAVPIGDDVHSSSGKSQTSVSEPFIHREQMSAGTKNPGNAVPALLMDFFYE